MMPVSRHGESLAYLEVVTLRRLAASMCWRAKSVCEYKSSS